MIHYDVRMFDWRNENPNIGSLMVMIDRRF